MTFQQKKPVPPTPSEPVWNLYGCYALEWSSDIYDIYPRTYTKFYPCVSLAMRAFHKARSLIRRKNTFCKLFLLSIHLMLFFCSLMNETERHRKRRWILRLF